MTILNICDNGDVLSILRIIRIAITIIRIVVPILLIISISITLLNAVKDKENDLVSKALKSIVIKIIAAILVFMIPTFVNLLANISSKDETYLSCIKSATHENIIAAYRLQAEKLIDTVTKTLTKSDYNIAKSMISKIKDDGIQAELNAELEEVKKYIDIRDEIYRVANNYDREAYLKVREKIEAIKDQEVRERLLAELKEVIGKKGSLNRYVLDPNDPLYRNLRHFDGKSLKQVLEENGSSVETLELQIKEAVDAVGVGTRQAPVVAALTLLETLAGYKYQINYEWGGKWHRVGINPNIGVVITPCCCESHPNPDYCRKTYIYKGFDCSGFVNWALTNGFRDNNYQTKTTGSSGQSLAGQNSAICDTGDALVSDKHIVLVVKPVDEMKSYLIVESTGGYGTRLSYYPYNSSGYRCMKIDYSN